MGGVQPVSVVLGDGNCLVALWLFVGGSSWVGPSWVFTIGLVLGARPVSQTLRVYGGALLVPQTWCVCGGPFLCPKFGVCVGGRSCVSHLVTVCGAVFVPQICWMFVGAILVHLNRGRCGDFYISTRFRYQTGQRTSTSALK